MKKSIFLSALLCSTLIFHSCDKEDAPAYNPNVKAPITLEFDQVAGAADLQLNTGVYTNNSGESFSVSKLKYYVSNIQLTRTDGSVYTVPQDESYFMIDESDPAFHEIDLDIPEGEYKTLQFVLGVDSLRNTMDISHRTGVLDPTGLGADMYWSWNSGYIFFKMEGTSTAAPAPTNEFMYHIGGYGGYSSATINNIKNITIDLSARGVARVKSGHMAHVHLMADVLQVFNASNTISIAANPVVMFSPFSTTVAGNYMNMFSHDHTHNE